MDCHELWCLLIQAIRTECAQSVDPFIFFEESCCLSSLHMLQDGNFQVCWEVTSIFLEVFGEFASVWVIDDVWPVSCEPRTQCSPCHANIQQFVLCALSSIDNICICGRSCWDGGWSLILWINNRARAVQVTVNQWSGSLGWILYSRRGPVFGSNNLVSHVDCSSVGYNWWFRKRLFKLRMMAGNTVVMVM